MPAQDACQPQIVRALAKDGWAVMVKPLGLYGAPRMLVYIDLKAPKGNAQIYIEVKCFPRANRTQALHGAFGQYIIYREVLAQLHPNAALYMAVPHDNADLATLLFQATIRNNGVKLIYVNLKQEVILRWNE